jgi:hypothetical protein
MVRPGILADAWRSWKRARGSLGSTATGPRGFTLEFEGLQAQTQALQGLLDASRQGGNQKMVEQLQRQLEQLQKRLQEQR